MRIIKLFVVCVGLTALSSCSVKKYIPEDEFLYTGAKLEIETDGKSENFDKVVSELEDVIRPKPNSELGVYFHYKVQREKPGFINRFFNKRRSRSTRKSARSKARRRANGPSERRAP